MQQRAHLPVRHPQCDSNLCRARPGYVERIVEDVPAPRCWSRSRRCGVLTIAERGEGGRLHLDGMVTGSGVSVAHMGMEACEICNIIQLPSSIIALVLALERAHLAGFET
jgi:hypothetical protein